MRLFDLLVLGPVVNSTRELRIQLPGRNGKIYYCQMSLRNVICITLSAIRLFFIEAASTWYLSEIIKLVFYRFLYWYELRLAFLLRSRRTTTSYFRNISLRDSRTSYEVVIVLMQFLLVRVDCTFLLRSPSIRIILIRLPQGSNLLVLRNYSLFVALNE